MKKESWGQSHSQGWLGRIVRFCGLVAVIVGLYGCDCDCDCDCKPKICGCGSVQVVTPPPPRTGNCGVCAEGNKVEVKPVVETPKQPAGEGQKAELKAEAKENDKTVDAAK